MAAAVMRDDAIALLAEEKHLAVPGISHEGPAVREQNRLPGSPVLVKDLGAVLRRDCAHDVLSFCLF
jgi:hypothetical protein